VREEVMVQCCALAGEKVDIKCVASFNIISIEERFAFLEKEEVGGGRKYGSFRRTRNGFLQNLTFPYIPANPREIDAE